MDGQQKRKLAVALGLAGAVLLVAAWLASGAAGPVLVLAGAGLGWLIARMAAPAVTAAPTQVPVPSEVEAPSVKPDPAIEGAAITALRHDLRGILSPAMLIADRLAAHGDPAVQRAGDVIARTVDRAAARLAETKKAGGDVPSPPNPPSSI
jgi:hypothetical protein